MDKVAQGQGEVAWVGQGQQEGGCASEQVWTPWASTDVQNYCLPSRCSEWMLSEQFRMNCSAVPSMASRSSSDMRLEPSVKWLQYKRH